MTVAVTVHAIFWRMCVVATYMMLFLAIGALGALFCKFVAGVLDNKDTKFYKFTKACVRFYAKSAQWLGSAIIVLYMIGLLGLLISSSVQHWRQIWGP